MSIQRLLRHLRNSFLNLGKTLTRPLSRFIQRGLRGLFGVGHQRQTGFVLPTVTMVMLVVSLLTLAMLLRSTDRAKNAHNFRVNEATLNATAPALDRAKAKIAAIFDDPNIPRGTPSDIAFMSSFGGLGNGIEAYTFGDEVPLKLAFDIDDDDNIGEADSGATKNTKADETVNTAWKFPVDTDNNGKFDSYTLYTILFRNPTTSGGEFTRARNPLEARNLPMEGASSSQCANNTGGGASLVGDSDWFKLPNEQKLKKAFFVYAATVPIGPDANGGLPTGLDANEYELFPGGSKGFSALEYQQDWSRIPLANNAVVYQDDLLMFAGSDQFFNGRIMTNANLMVGKGKNVKNFETKFFLVSSKDSCFYDPESSKILVGGNVGNNRYDDFEFANGTDPVDEIHLFQGEGNDPDVNENFGKEVTVTTETLSAKESLYNNKAYNERISYLVNAAMQLGTGAYPKELLAGRAATDVTEREAKDYYTQYFKKLTRQVPYIEVQPGDDAKFIPTISSGTGIGTGGILVPIDTEAKAKTFFALSHGSDPDTTGLDPLRPPRQWMFPVDPENNATTYMVSRTDSTKKLELELTRIPATNPEELDGKEERIGDRVLVGNNLPETIYDNESGLLVSGSQAKQVVKDSTGAVKWRKSGSGEDSDKDRTRQSQVTTLPDLGDLSRDGQWEIDAATAPKDKFDNVGGLRVITGAGIYLPGANSTKTAPTLDEEGDDKNTVIWPDYFPVAKNHSEVMFDHDNNPTTDSVSVDSANNTTRPYLRMRASVVYHHSDSAFADNGYEEDTTHQTPLACVANYYDPTDATSDSSNSKNGEVFSWNASAFNLSLLQYQAALRYPGVVYKDGTNVLGDRLVNPLLASALDKSTSASSTDRTLAEQTAVDAAVCATMIMNGGSSSSNIPANAIKEVAFLDARQIKANDVHSLKVTGGGSGIYTLESGMPDPDFEVGDQVTIEEYQRTDAVDKNIPKIVRGEITAISGDNITVSTTDAVYADSSPAISADGTGWITESLSSRYDLPIEERYPLEIRATQIDLDQLRQERRGSFSDPEEYLLPNSGIIYATREDALPDQTVWVEDGTETTKRTGDAEPDLPQSSTDFKLDPTRHPNGILLMNGSALNRGTTNDYRAEEKGFILATDLPVYIKGDFNLHKSGADLSVEEFTEDLNKTTYANFYTRSTLEAKFACRKDQPGCDGDGDTWRSATVFADAVTLLSDNFEFGYRSDGNYDLNNNQGDARSIAKRRNNGFYTNDFAASRNFTDADYSGSGGSPSSYFTNFVTPVQRRVNFPEYVMEICEKLPVSECEPKDWHIIGYDADKSGTVDTTSINEIGGLKLDLDQSGDTATFSTTATSVDEASFGISLNNDGTLETIDPSTVTNEDGLGIDLNKDNSISGSVAENEIKIKASELPFLDRYLGIATKKVDLQSGTTVTPPTDATLVKFPRRIAFLRNGDNELVFGPNDTPIALGINGSSEVGYYSYGALASPVLPGKYGNAISELSLTPTFEPTVTDGVPQPIGNALWFRTTSYPTDPKIPNAPGNEGWRYHSERYLAYSNDLSTDSTVQPLLIPILQIHAPTASPEATSGADGRPMEVDGSIASNGTFTIEKNSNKDSLETDWVQHANTGGTTFNLVFVSGDTPGRPDELNRSLGNFPRFLEDWKGVNANITGSFIQKGRSVYATGPTDSVLNSESTVTNGIYGKQMGLFDEDQFYAAGNASGILPFYNAPKRPWGFDVALLTQAPDLFAQRFAIKDDTPPNEFYREVKRDDEWVQTLLCAAQPDKRVNPADNTQTVTQAGGYEDAGDPYDKDVKITENDTAVNYQFAISADQRPNTCPVPNN
ncbi:hormogonium polysaccharide biosynthesis protein HpsA [Roseofilum sp. BLCC_M91]|uniref:Hormogonium polysaccharide biosynthesis protein HpsA n=1 Tax=Roseofilum halophilum BLCC-M91 TaxID=3022259 RepID=A0ABT7BHY1_9CYAN|nr:hormogonium polysaccharide biosynthesis protein HpsA [Roseofilum halophilum]MDJ1178786.1 hormogonium polysaccharide biosynthesis protein HpsA [Roseofilum halophilum BLCC-M91]